MMLFRRILEEASTAAEAEAILRARPADVATTLMVLDAAGGNFIAELSVGGTAIRRPEQGILYATNHFIAPELAEPVVCNRLEFLHANFRGATSVDETAIRRMLAGTGPQSNNIQSMVFFPARRGLALSSGTIPAAQGVFQPLSGGILFAEP